MTARHEDSAFSPKKTAFSGQVDSRRLLLSAVRVWSGEDLVAEAAVGDAADHVLRVHGVGEAEVDGAGFVEGLHLVGREGDVSAGDVVLELGEFAGADDGDYRDGAVAQPCEGDLRQAFADLIGDGFQCFDDAVGALLIGQEVLHHRVAHAAVVSSRIFAVIFAAENSAGEGRPGGDADVERFRHGDEFAFDGAFDQAVFDLHGDEGGPAAQGRELIPNVNPVKIDVVGFQAFKTGFDGLRHVFAVIAGGFDVFGGK